MSNRWREIKKTKQSNLNVNKHKNFTEKFESPCSPLFSRFKAFLTDLFLITTPIFYIVIYLVMGSGEDFAQNKGNGWLIILSINMLIIVGFWIAKGQTPGLKAYSIKLVKNKTHDKINFIQAISRYILTLIAIISIILMFLPFFRKDKRTFQDIFSNTLIIDE